MLSLRGITKVYGDRTAVDGVDLDIADGQFVGVIGRSGAGKSTLLRMINRLVEPTAGAIVSDGVDVLALTGASLRHWRCSHAMIFQQFNLVGRLDVLTNVLIGRVDHVRAWRALTRVWSVRDRAIAFAALEQLGIADLAAQDAASLSGGQQQRVAIARALVQEPAMILADEPTASLDPSNTEIVMKALSEISAGGKITVLCNLHSIETARAYCDRLVGMADGRVVFDGTPAALTDAAARTFYGMDDGPRNGTPITADTPDRSPPGTTPTA